MFYKVFTHKHSSPQHRPKGERKTKRKKNALTWQLRPPPFAYLASLYKHLITQPSYLLICSSTWPYLIPGTCLLQCFSDYLPAYLLTALPACLNACLTVDLHACLLVSPSTCRRAFLSTYLPTSICLPSCLSSHLPDCLSTRLSACLHSKQTAGLSISLPTCLSA